MSEDSAMTPTPHHAIDGYPLEPAELDQPGWADEDETLRQDPFADDLARRLAVRAPRRYASRTTAVLAGLLLVVAGFVAGAQVQRHWGTPVASAGTGARGTFPGAGGPTGAGAGTGRTGTGGSTITGTVKLVDGTTVYLETANGQVVTVTTTGTTTVLLTGTLGQLAAGATVSVTGQTGTDGTVAATSITKAK